MTTEEILYSVSDGIATITLNRPDKLNAWTATMEREVRAGIEAAEADNAVRVIILTGAGRGFCAGADMSLLGMVASQGVDARVREQALRAGGVREGVRADFQKKYSYFPAVTKPVIAAINGPVVGLGLVIALYCDIRFASDTATLWHGVLAAWLDRRIRAGVAAAAHRGAAECAGAAVFGAHGRCGGSAAHGIGQRGVSHKTCFRAKVREYARDLAANVSPRSMRVMKRQVYEGMFQTLAEAFELSEREMLASLQCEDFKEGVAHFVEKRAAAFTGK